MKKIYIMLLFLLISLCFFLEASMFKTPVINATDKQKQAYNDNKEIYKLYESVRNNSEFDKLQGRAPYLELDKQPEFISFIKNMEENVEKINKNLDALSKKYGSTSKEQDAAYKKIYAGIYAKNSDIAGVDHFWSSSLFSENYKNIKNRISKIDDTKNACVEKLITDVNSALSTIHAVLADYRGPIYEKALKTLDIVLMYDADNKQAKELIKKIEEENKSVLEARAKEIDKGKWPGQCLKFAGPGNLDDLSRFALEWFKNDERGWAGDNPQCVAVKGDWISAKKNLLGQTIQWGLPIYLAVHKKEDSDIVRVFSLTILTAEEASVKKAPPFTGAWVGDNFDMRLKNLPSTGSSSNGNSKGPFIIFRLLLSTLLLSLGAVTISEKLSSLNPKVKQFVDILLPHKDMIGASTAVIAMLFFLKNLFFMAPLSDIFPQLIAILTGIVVGAKFFEEKTKEMKVPEKLSPMMRSVNNLFVKNKVKLDNATAHLSTLGYVCLTLGVLHLFIGGIILF